MKRLYAVTLATAALGFLYGIGSSADLSTENQAS